MTAKANGQRPQRPRFVWTEKQKARAIVGALVVTYGNGPRWGGLRPIVGVYRLGLHVLGADGSVGSFHWDRVDPKSVCFARPAAPRG